MDNKIFKGIFPALITPFAKDGSIAYDVLKAHIDMLIERGVQGFYICGSTAEVFMLTEEERKELYGRICGFVNGRVRIIAHVGDVSADKAAAYARIAEEAGADAVSAIAPFYYKFTAEEIHEYYRMIARASSLPLLVYHFPGASGAPFNVGVYRSFKSDIPTLAGVKFTSNEFYILEQIKRADPDCVILNGFDEMFLSGLGAGADGGIGSTYNLMPEKYIKLRELFLAGDALGAQKIQHEVNEVIDLLLEKGCVASIKAVLSARTDMDYGDCRAPFRKLTDAEKAEISAKVNALIG